ncbi:uncharacterized protein si:ch73-95l15.5 isoform X2 [Dunckerocampus dactyliophorus]|uniref:uncharacterized protein si:ch73-95l15.5 isoform X2 n=1 Tax=Dunckerocampus dactyliophorus TaxID=161453 RepID=UPI00240493B1|nr:uncharacterized protein si:ch73-95l15.5 isoform X2 [Dunckerocampus dactyliophorus]
MASRSPNDFCRICGGALQGNQRRWLFGGQHKKAGQPQTPTRSLRGGSLSGSSPSSPWGSMSSLGSSSSLSKSQLSLNSPSKNMDLMAVLTHILGQSVVRGGGRGEFVCGKCMCVLERVFKFDSVIARVRVLSSERLHKLTQERDRIRRWVRQNYTQRHPQDVPSEEDGEAEKEGYREMLKENMALSEYECWSEKWDTCPYFIRTGKRCKKGQNCEGCDSLRVSDSDYESVCGVPRHIPFQLFSPLALSRDKSHSMPLHWQRIPSVCSSPASLAASTFSLRAPSRTESIHSLDSLDGFNPFDSPGDHSVSCVLRALRCMEGRPVSSPSGSRIPVLARKNKRRRSSEVASPTVSGISSFGDVENGEHEDVLMELKDEFLPLHQQSDTRRVQQVVRHLRGQLDQAEARVRSLESALKPSSTKVNEDATHFLPEENCTSLLPRLARSLHSRDRLIQECMAVIRRVCVEGEGRGGVTLAEEIINKLRENLKEILSDEKVAMKSLASESAEKEKRLEEEVSSLRKAAGDRERDLDTLNTVLQGNQDVINGLRVALNEKEHHLQEVEKEREVWRQRDRALAATMQEKEELIHVLKVELESCQRDVQALSNSVICQGLAGGGAEATLASQLREKQSHLAALLKEREGHSTTLCQEVTKLTAALQDYQTVVESQQENQARTTSSLMAQLNDARRALRGEEKRRKEADRTRQNQREDSERVERKLRDSLEKRDQLIEEG